MIKLIITQFYHNTSNLISKAHDITIMTHSLLIQTFGCFLFSPSSNEKLWKNENENENT